MSMAGRSKCLYGGDGVIKELVGAELKYKDCVQRLKDILKVEDCKAKHPFKREVALNVDAVEIIRSKGRDRSQTVDFVVGMDRNVLLLVEAKFNVKDVENIKAKEVYGKIKHSKELLSAFENFSHLRFQIDDSTVILLSQTKQFQQQKNKLKRKFNNDPHIIPHNVFTFHVDYFKADCFCR
jgi:hypothetical protein